MSFARICFLCQLPPPVTVTVTVKTPSGVFISEVYVKYTLRCLDTLSAAPCSEGGLDKICEQDGTSEPALHLGRGGSSVPRSCFRGNEGPGRFVVDTGQLPGPPSEQRPLWAEPQPEGHSWAAVTPCPGAAHEQWPLCISVEAGPLASTGPIPAVFTAQPPPRPRPEPPCILLMPQSLAGQRSACCWPLSLSPLLGMFSCLGAGGGRGGDPIPALSPSGPLGRGQEKTSQQRPVKVFVHFISCQEPEREHHFSLESGIGGYPARP